MKEVFNHNNVTFFLDKWECFSSEGGSYMVFVKGSLVSVNNTCKTENWIVKLLHQLASYTETIIEYIQNELRTLRGFYSIVIISGSEYYIITDIIRSIPLFYGFQGNSLFITDSLEYFQRNHSSFEIDDNKLEVFIYSGMVYGRNTIYKNVFGMQAGEIVIIHDRRIKSVRYFSFIPSINVIKDNELSNYVQDYDRILISIFTRIINQNPNVNNWIVPLSGGHDSRLTISYLYRLGIKNVICFSYGTPKNEQSVISRQLAEILKYEWHFVEYTEKKWDELHKLGIVDDYILYAFNGVSTPHLQDLLAVHELHNQNVLSKGDIFLKSHGDFIAGSQLSDLDMKLKTEEDAVSRVVTRHRNINVKSEVSRREAEEIFQNIIVEPKHFQEYFNWQERQAKFIVNSKKVYEYFGYECQLPFWYKESVDFWLSVPSDLRLGRKMFLDFENHGILIAQLQGIAFAKGDSATTKTSSMNLIKRIIPSTILVAIFRITRRKIRLNEAMNMIYALKARSVKQLLAPIEEFPKQTLYCFKEHLFRRPYQMSSHLLTSLYTIRLQLDIRQDRNKGIAHTHINTKRKQDNKKAYIERGKE